MTVMRTSDSDNGIGGISSLLVYWLGSFNLLVLHCPRSMTDLLSSVLRPHCHFQSVYLSINIKPRHLQVLSKTRLLSRLDDWRTDTCCERSHTHTHIPALRSSPAKRMEILYESATKRMFSAFSVLAVLLWLLSVCTYL